MDTAQDINKSTSLESFIDDPTPAQHVPNALRGFGTILERVAGGKSLDDLYSKIRACVVDVRQDPDLQKWARQFFDHLKKSLDEPGYARSDEAKEKRKVLSKDWKKFQDDSNPAGKKWADDWEAFKLEWEQFTVRIEEDKDLQRLRAAHEKLGGDLQNGLVEVGKEAGRAGAQVQSGMQAALEQASWFAQDMFKVYAPRMLEMLKDVPIPRLVSSCFSTHFVLTRPLVIELSTKTTKSSSSWRMLSCRRSNSTPHIYSFATLPILTCPPPRLPRRALLVHSLVSTSKRCNSTSKRYLSGTKTRPPRWVLANLLD